MFNDEKINEEWRIAFRVGEDVKRLEDKYAPSWPKYQAETTISKSDYPNIQIATIRYERNTK